MNGQPEAIFEQRSQHQSLRLRLSRRRRWNVCRRPGADVETVSRNPVGSTNELEPLDLIGESNQLKERLVADIEGPGTHTLDKTAGLRGLIGFTDATSKDWRVNPVSATEEPALLRHPLPR
jgi:hypothetical protein